MFSLPSISKQSHYHPTCMTYVIIVGIDPVECCMHNGLYRIETVEDGFRTIQLRPGPIKVLEMKVHARQSNGAVDEGIL